VSVIVRSRYTVTGMDCGSCASKVDAVVRRLQSVEDVTVSATSGTMTVHHDAEAKLYPQIKVSLKSIGYDVTPLVAQQNGEDSDSLSHEHAAPGAWWRSRKGLLTIACGLSLGIAYVLGKLVPPAEPWIFLAALVVGLLPITWRALISVRLGNPFSIEMLMTIAAVGAVIIGATEEAAAVVFLFLVGELLEGVAAGQARASIQGLTGLVPDIALLERNGHTEEVAASSLAIGALIVVRPGDRIAADGDITDGASDINESSVTGESTPVRKTVGDKVFAGTINTDGVLRIRVSAIASDNTIARVVRLVEEAQESKAPTERFIDRFSFYYTPGVVLVGFLVAVIPPTLFGGSWSEWTYKGLAILLIGCPCALVISTPAAIAAALSAGARRGLLLKGGAVLETMRKITTVAFDKTGTLTEGRPKVTDVIGCAQSASQVLSIAAALESGSNHPLAIAILAKAKAESLPVPPAASVKAVAGKGVSGMVGGVDVLLASQQAARERAKLTPDQDAQIASLNDAGNTVSVVVAEDKISGLIAMRDEPRPDAKAGIQALREMGISTLMLTGDNRRTAAAIANGLGMEARAELLPQDKQRIVGELQKQGQMVAKVGDGINDAPALAAADVGIAMGGGTDVALETADAAILHGRVLDVARMIMLSQATMANIGQNITIALGLKAVFLVTTIVGLTGLWPAILADTGATVLVTLNAMRLLAWRGYLMRVDKM
jgi:Zn2+/Cd2+-exporting ATPase